MPYRDIDMNENKMLRIRSNIAGILAVIWMGVIFIFSAQNNEESSVVSEGFSDRIVGTAGWLFRLHLSEERLYEIAYAIEFFIRKAAHMTEFAILAVLLYIWLCRWQLTRLRRYGLAVAATILYACSDEFHQLFVEGRAGQISDVAVDGMGALLGLALFLLLQEAFRRMRRKKT